MRSRRLAGILASFSILVGLLAGTAGSAPIVALASAPDPPTGVTGTVTNASLGQVTVSWTPPTNNGGSPITYYGISSYPETPPGGTVVIPAPVSPAPNSYAINYYGNAQLIFIMIAYNGAWSGWSQWSTPYMNLGITQPAAPTGLTVSSTANQQVSLSWTAPTSTGGAPIFKYEVSTTGTPAETWTFGNVTSAAVTGNANNPLNNGSAYTFEVEAFNTGNYYSPWSSTVSATPTGAVAAAPTNVTATAGNGQATVTWTAPSLGSYTLYSYTVVASPGGQTEVVTGTSATVLALTNGIAYNFSVEANTEDSSGNFYQGSWGQTTGAVTPSGSGGGWWDQTQDGVDQTGGYAVPEPTTGSISAEASFPGWPHPNPDGSCSAPSCTYKLDFFIDFRPLVTGSVTVPVTVQETGGICGSPGGGFNGGYLCVPSAQVNMTVNSNLNCNGQGIQSPNPSDPGTCEPYAVTWNGDSSGATFDVVVGEPTCYGTNNYCPVGVEDFREADDIHNNQTLRLKAWSDPSLGYGPGGLGPAASETTGGGSPWECGCAGIGTTLPVNDQTGEFWHSFTDVTVPGRGLPLQSIRTYSSTLASQNGPFGYGWTSNYNMSLSLDTAGDATVHGPNGSTLFFICTNGLVPPPSPVQCQAGSFQGSTRYHAGLAISSGGTYTLTQWDGTQYVFDSTSQHRVSQATDHNGYVTTLSYDGNGNLTVTAKRDLSASPATQTLYFAATNGVFTSVTDQTASPNRTVSFSYDGNGNLISQTDPGGTCTTTPLHCTTFGYDSSHRMLWMKDPNCYANTYISGCQAESYSTCFTAGSPPTSTCDFMVNYYDASGRIQGQFDPARRLTQFSYGTGTDPATGAAAQVTTIVDPAGYTSYEYYVNGQLSSVTKAIGTSLSGTWSYTRDQGTLQVTALTGPTGVTTHSTYYPDGDLKSADDGISADKYLYNSYNGFHEVLSTTDPLGVTTSYSYDSHGNLTGQCQPILNPVGTSACSLQPNDCTTATTTEAHTCYAYADAFGDANHPGDLKQMVDPYKDAATTYLYDQYGYRCVSTDPLNNQTAYFHDSIGRMTYSITPKGAPSPGGYGTACPTTVPSSFKTTYAINALGSVTRATDPLGNYTQYNYDPDGNIQQVIDSTSAHNTTSYQYDADGEMTLETRADNSYRQSGYDADGNLISQTDGGSVGASHVMTYHYNPLQVMDISTDGLQRQSFLTYDLAGRLLTGQDAKGNTTTYTYYANNKVNTIAYSDGITHGVTYNYDADGQRSSMVDGIGTTSYVYDSLGRLTKVTDGTSNVLQYGFDLSHHETLTYPGGVNQATYTTDADGRLHTVADWLSHTTTYNYDADSNLNTIGYPNGVTTTYTPDGADRLSSIVASVGGSNFVSLSYARAGNGQLTSDIGSSYQNYQYDSLNRLCWSWTGTSTNSCLSPPSGSTQYKYDSADRLTQVGSTNLCYDAADELTATSSSSCPQTATYAYDANGNRTSGNGSSYGWDQANRLCWYLSGSGSGACTANGRPTNSELYTYDGDGQRMAKTPWGGSAETFVWDVSAGTPEIVQDGSLSYINGLGGLPLEQVSGSTVYYYHQDQLGSTVAISCGAQGTGCAGAGSRPVSYTYTPYGGVSATGSDPVGNPFQYTGAYRDSESGLYYLRARYYDPSTEQFISRDPAVASTHEPYSYAGDTPLNATDPSGLDPGFDLGPWAEEQLLNGNANRFANSGFVRTVGNFTAGTMHGIFGGDFATGPCLDMGGWAYQAGGQIGEAIGFWGPVVGSLSGIGDVADLALAGERVVEAGSTVPDLALGLTNSPKTGDTLLRPFADNLGAKTWTDEPFAGIGSDLRQQGKSWDEANRAIIDYAVSKGSNIHFNLAEFDPKRAGLTASELKYVCGNASIRAATTFYGGPAPC